MRIRYVPLEEAHPPFKRVEDTVIGEKMLQAFKNAAYKGKLRIEPPEEIRRRLLEGKKRHAFR